MLSELVKQFPWPEQKPESPDTDKRAFNITYVSALNGLCIAHPRVIVTLDADVQLVRTYLRLRPHSRVVAVESSAPHRQLLFSQCWDYRDRLAVIPSKDGEWARMLLVRDLPVDVVVNGVSTTAPSFLAASVIINSNFPDAYIVGCEPARDMDALMMAANQTRRGAFVSDDVWLLSPKEK